MAFYAYCMSKTNFAGSFHLLLTYLAGIEFSFMSTIRYY